MKEVEGWSRKRRTKIRYIQWIPGHVGIKRNELADDCVNRGTKRTDKSGMKVTIFEL